MVAVRLINATLKIITTTASICVSILGEISVRDLLDGEWSSSFPFIARHGFGVGGQGRLSGSSGFGVSFEMGRCGFLNAGVNALRSSRCKGTWNAFHLEDCIFVPPTCLHDAGN